MSLKFWRAHPRGWHWLMWGGGSLSTAGIIVGFALAMIFDESVSIFAVLPLGFVLWLILHVNWLLSGSPTPPTVTLHQSGVKLEEVPWWQDGPILFAILWMPAVLVLCAIGAGISALVGKVT